jgi:hypothetical protein
MHRCLAIVFILAGLPLGIVRGQAVLEPKQLDYSSLGVLYETERAADFRPHSNGMAIGMYIGKLVKYYKTTYYVFDLGFLKHPKEFRQSISFNTGNPFSANSSSFSYGKQNQFYVLRGGLGVKRYYSEKAKRKGVAVGVNYEFGASLGIVKPYYLDLLRVNENGYSDYISTEKYSEENHDLFLDNTKIVGPGPFFKGFDEISIVPGVHGRIGAHFSLGAFEEFVRAFEMGIMVDAFTQRVPIMIIENNTPVFINGYISLQLGKRR